jgi:predicted XRE-type DNA-binding protein
VGSECQIRSTSVWDALEDTAAEAANMRARSELMIALRTKIEGWKVSQTEAARRLGLTQPRLNDLMRGHNCLGRHIFIDYCHCLRYRLHRIPLMKDASRRHRPTERVRFPRARARHLRSRAVSEQRPAGTMTGLRGARWTGTGNSASQEARPELSCGVGSLQQAPRWNADRRRVAWILCAQTCVHLSAWTRAAPPPLSSPASGRG